MMTTYAIRLTKLLIVTAFTLTDYDLFCVHQAVAGVTQMRRHFVVAVNNRH